MLFWILCVILAVSVSAVLVRAILRGRIGELSPAAYDLQIYRDQLAEVDRDMARGVISHEDAERTRIEVSRRILAADAQLQTQQNSGHRTKTSGWLGIAVLAVILVGGSVAIYWAIGARGYPDLPLAARLADSEQAAENRLGQTEAEARLPVNVPNTEASQDFLDLMERLRKTVSDRPDDLQGYVLLARNEAALGNFQAAYQAQEKVLELKAGQALSDDFADYADMLISAAGGYVSKEAQEALANTLERDPKNSKGLYYMGLYFSQIDRPDKTFRIWRDLLENSPPEAPWVSVIRGQISNVVQLAGVKYSPSPEAQQPGPDAEDIKAAENMSETDRQNMIRGMVSRLAERLANTGGSAEEWARLIAAYGVLRETDKAQTVWTEAQEVFASSPEALTILRTAAQKAGIAK